MKANAPEKIYIPTILAANAVRYKTEGSIEYCRIDAFIEKALRWMIRQGGVNDALSREMIEDFKNYMEGE